MSVEVLNIESGVILDYGEVFGEEDYTDCLLDPGEVQITLTDGRVFTLYKGERLEINGQTWEVVNCTIPLYCPQCGLAHTWDSHKCVYHDADLVTEPLT